MFAADSISATDLTHAGALLLGLGLGIFVTLKVVRHVFQIKDEWRNHDR